MYETETIAISEKTLSKVIHKQFQVSSSNGIWGPVVDGDIWKGHAIFIALWLKFENIKVKSTKKPSAAHVRSPFQ